MDEVEFQAQFRPSGSTLAAVLGRVMVPDRAEQEEKQAAKAAEVARAARNEELALANAVAGNPLAELSRAQSVVGMARDTVRDLEARLSGAREVLSRAEGNMTVWSGQVEELQADVARRSSAAGDLLSPAKAAHQEFVQATRAAFAAVQTGTAQRTSRRPFAAEVVRSENCLDCIEQGATDEEAFLLHNDPDHPLPVRPPGQAANAARGSDSGYAEISR